VVLETGEDIIVHEFLAISSPAVTYSRLPVLKNAQQISSSQEQKEALS
jgi:hypothetical protein